MSDPEISDSLRRIVPDDLSPEGLVDGARRKRRRRTGLVGAMAALALVGLAVPLALNLPNNDQIIAQPAETPSVQQPDGTSAASVLPGAAACYNDDGTPISWTQEETGPAEPGAVKAWFCGDYSPETGQGFVGPLEPLTSGLDSIIEDVQAAEVIDLTRTTCMSGYRLSFNAVFEYADGSRRIIGGDRHGCGTTYDGGVVRVGVEEFYGALYTAWETQRETDDGDWVIPQICPGPFSLIEMYYYDAVQGSVCAEGFLDSNPGRVAGYLSDELLKEVVESIAVEMEGGEDMSPATSSAPEIRYWLTLSNKFTDYLRLVRHDDGVFRADQGDGLGWFWKPSPELLSRLDQALVNGDETDPTPPRGFENPGVTNGTDTPEDPGTSPDMPMPWAAEGCEGVANGELMSSALPDGTLPDGAERIWLCSGDVFGGSAATPMEPLTDSTLISDAVASFNDLVPMPADSACTMELGPSYLVVHEYADGTRYAVQVQEYGCRPVVAGETILEGGEQYLAGLADLWGQQRTEQGTTQTRPGPLCELYTSLIPVQSDATFTSATACTALVERTGKPGAEIPIPAELLPSIVEGVSTATEPSVEGATDSASIVLLTSAGDPLMLYRMEDGAFYWSEGERTKFWAPTGETAQALTALFEK